IHRRPETSRGSASRACAAIVRSDGGKYPTPGASTEFNRVIGSYGRLPWRWAPMTWPDQRAPPGDVSLRVHPETSLGETHATCPCRGRDRKSTRLNSSHVKISYAVFCLK